MSKTGLVLSLLLALPSAALCQRPRAFGNVSGFVFCADTNTPARLAAVVLRPVPAPASAASTGTPAPAVEGRVVHTQLDGSFSIPQVPAGRYFVLASLEGYVSPLAPLGISQSDLLKADDRLRATLLKDVPNVVVEGGSGASINISLERGAAVAGTVLFDDGSPAPGLRVNVLTRKQGKWVPIEISGSEGMTRGVNTDDRGAYRISGIPPAEEYLIQVELRMANTRTYYSGNGFATQSGIPTTIAFYSGGALRTQSAKPFALKLGEERPGEDIVVPLAKLHKVQGTVTARRDGHVVNQAGLSLLFADDKTPAGATNLNRDETGFSFAFVPEGDYILRVSNAADVQFEDIPNAPGSVPPTHTDSHTLATYGSVEVPIHIEGDRYDLTVAVPDPPTQAKSVP